MVKYIDLLRAHQHKEKADELSHQTDDVAQMDAEPATSLESHALEPQLPNDDVNREKDAGHTPPQNEKIKRPTDTHTDLSSTKPAADSIGSWLNKCIHLVLIIFQHAQQDKATPITPLSTHIEKLLSQLEADQHHKIMDSLELSVAQKTRKIQKIHLSLGSLVQKSILMMLYTIKIGQHLKLHTDDLQSHTLAAMLHHIGMAQIPADIRHKKERLNKKDKSQIKQAPQYSHDFLMRCNARDKHILEAALQTPERFDGSGENGLSGTNIAWVARLTSILSIFEALTHDRPYRARLLPRDAIREIVKHHKKSFDIVMLKALIESISLYPIGTYVQLNSKEIGLVVHIHSRLPLRPIIHIQMDLQGRDIPLRQVDLKKQPNLTIEKCMYKETIHDLKSG